MNRITIIRVVFVVSSLTLTVSCTKDQTQGRTDKTAASRNVVALSEKVDLPDSARRLAIAFLSKQKIDLTPYDMSKAGIVQRMELRGKKAWRVAWKLRNFEGKEGELLVLVKDDGQCELAMGQ